MLFGASIGRQCIERGLVDELLIHLVPVLLGDGLRLFERPGGQPVRLHRLSLGQSGQVTDLRFSPAHRP
ncbi:MAG TPA: dihydrofolate reductase family protein [Actinomycetes bacterium]|nr:dihydrofolate reductase family protein [Actinomycetes bacterium]